MMNKNAISKEESLFVLIKNLSKSEKRSFKLYANRTGSSTKNNVNKFVQLFDAIDKMEEYDESILSKKISGYKKSQLPNLKRHLFHQILTSLRLISIQKNVEIQIREQIDFAQLLYEKGLYLQSLSLLDRIKAIAKEHHQDILQLEIIEFQKLIEERHITRSRQSDGKVESLLDEASRRSDIIANACRLSNLKIKMHGWYIQMGHAKNGKDRKMVEAYFKSNIVQIKQRQLTFFEKISFYQAYVWYHYIMLDFRRCYQYSKKWVALFDASPALKDVDPDLYMRGQHYILTSLYNMRANKKFALHLASFEEFVSQYNAGFNKISETIAFLYIYTSRLNSCFLRGDFNEGVQLIPEILRKIRLYKKHIDLHRIMMFYYKIAYLYVGVGQFEKALDYLNKVLDLKVGHLREDIQSYARLLQLIVHYELGNYILLDHLANSTQRFLDKLEELNQVQKETLRMIRQVSKRPQNEHIDSLKSFYQRLKKLHRDPSEKRAFLYLDVLTWAQSKIEEKSLNELTRKKIMKK